MSIAHSDILIGATPLHHQNQTPTGAYVDVWGETYYRIGHVDQMPPFFMSVVSGADHWLFIASNGGLTAGRTNANSALFPYETEDKLIAHSDRVGGTTLLQVARNGRCHLWQPFSNQYRGVYRCTRNLYKNLLGNKLIFEEINEDLRLTWRAVWRTGDRFGFIRTGWLQNDGQPCTITLLDGLQNVLPYGATTWLQNTQSNLLHAYKRSELELTTGLGIFALNATLTDRAEPSESLMATVVWQAGLAETRTLLSTRQLAAFRRGEPIVTETDVCGRAGAYFVNASFALAAGQSRQWHVVADVNQDSAAVVQLVHLLRQDADAVMRQVEEDIDATTAVLQRTVAAADGIQQTAVTNTGVHHFANVMFNVMRGGVFIDGYRVNKQDLLAFVRTRNRPALAAHGDWFAALPPQIAIDDLYARAAETAVPDLIRLCYEYLPLTFSRRHGDPSRPWNHFSINLKHADGSPRLDYQGNWRDIFQNWEALLLSFPAYTPGVIAKFLNATTADGYNPYRVTRAGIEWEAPEPENPWANIGYWSDHQIIYLQKLLEIAEQTQPGLLRTLWRQPIFAAANVPYRIRPYPQMLRDWYNTIDFDWPQQKAIEQVVAQMGTDGRLRRDAAGGVIHVTMMEKLLVLLLAKLANFVPAGGIWMNTQRPEWNDANNALVGKGLSVVTAAYLRRFIVFWRAQLAGLAAESFGVDTAVAQLFTAVQHTFAAHRGHLQTGFDDGARRAVMDELGAAITTYRVAVYDRERPHSTAQLSGQAVDALLALAQAYIDHTLRANRRSDDLYHSYNVLRLADGEAAVEHLYPMLEGQVAILSSGLLAPGEALALLRSLRRSDLYRADQHSYMLYPNRTLPGFLQKNRVPAARLARSALAQALAAADDGRLLVRNAEGDYHFNGRFHNANDVIRALDELGRDPAYADLAAAERDEMLALFEETFNHRAFTGRSGTFFAYEGLGSIYWHMVSKLLLAVQEIYQAALDDGADAAVTAELAAAYDDIRAGLGFNKTPAVYGAFPTDPYSHTPWGRGAQQPGMTGQVKEEILTRWGELGIRVRAGIIHFAPTLLPAAEFLTEPDRFRYVDAAGRPQTTPLPANSLAFTFCQTPIIYTQGDTDQIDITYNNGDCKTLNGRFLDAETSQHILDRDGKVKLVQVMSKKFC